MYAYNLLEDSRYILFGLEGIRVLEDRLSIYDKTLSLAGKAADAKAVGDALAQQSPNQGALIATITSKFDIAAGFTYSCDKTADELWAAHENGRTVIIDWGGVQGLIPNFAKDIALSATEKENQIYFGYTVSNYSMQGIIHQDNSVTATTHAIVFSSMVRDGTGDSNNYVMSQKATTEALNTKITIPATAEVGQLLSVKAVDENGKPTEWEAVEYQPGTPYDKVDYIVPETTVEGNSLEATINEILVDGETYVVNWEGVDYTCVCTTRSGGGTTGQLIGNLVWFDGEDTGEPFVIVTVLEGGNKVGLVKSIDDTVTSFTFSLKGKKAVPIPDRYLTNAYPYCVEVTAEYYDDGGIKGLTCAESGYTLLDLYRSGRSITVKMNRPEEEDTISIWWIYQMCGVIQMANGTIALGFTNGQLANNTLHPIIYIFIGTDGQVGLEALYHS